MPEEWKVDTTEEKGAMDVYDFGTVRLHAYRTNDAINDEVFFFEKEGKAVALESPCFRLKYSKQMLTLASCFCSMLPK